MSSIVYASLTAEKPKQITCGLWKRLLFVGLFSLGLGACSSDNDNDSSEPEVNTLTVGSYNVGLALNFVPYTNERLVNNLSLLEDYETDVICLQEVWLPDQVEAIEEILSERYPHIFTVPAEQVFSESAACTVEEIAGFDACTREQCDGLTGSDLIACAPVQCGTFFADLSPQCFDGLTSAVGIPDVSVDAVIDAITQPAGKFAFDGALGLMLAAKLPLENREFQDFIDDSSTNHRGALYADVSVGDQEVVLGCTHPTAGLSIPYPASGRHGSWEGENRFMQAQMIAYANDKASGRPIVFGGDFNCSIDNPANNVDAAFAANCQLWLDDGFVDPAAEQLPCTFCNEENLILLEGGGSSNTLLDHIFVKNIDDTDSIIAERTFDETISIEALVPPSELQPEDSPLLTHPSDHYGVELLVPLP